MSILPFNHLASSFMPNISEKVVELLSPQQKRIALVALIVFSYIAVAAYFVWKKCFKGSVNTPAVEEVAPKQNLPTTASNEQLESDEKLCAFYEKKNIVTGKEPIQVDVDTLGLDLTEEDAVRVLVRTAGEPAKFEKQTVTLRKVTEDVIAEINSCIENSSDEKSTKEKRRFILNTNDDPLKAYQKLGFSGSGNYISAEDEKKLWLARIIQALIDKGHLFKLYKEDGNGYYLQA